MMIILDLGSGNTCRNDRPTIERMIAAVADVDTERRCVLKWQLWDKGSEPQCIRLHWQTFGYAYEVAERLGFRTTASVFDKPSLDALLAFDVPFVKIANRPYLRHLARYIPRGIPIVASRRPDESTIPKIDGRVDWLTCISEYPAHPLSYGDHESTLTWGISDHTVGLDLWHKYHPAVYEKHFCLDDSTGPDAGPWALRPSTLKELLDASW